MKKLLNIHNFSTLGQNIMKPTQSTPYSLRAFEWYQEVLNLRDLNVTPPPPSPPKKPSFIDS
jgi:hypothetical protein